MTELSNKSKPKTKKIAQIQTTTKGIHARSNKDVPEVLKEEAILSEKGGVVVDSVVKKGDITTTERIHKVKLKTAKRMKKIKDNTAKKPKDETLPKDTIIKDPDIAAEVINNNKRELDSIISNLKNSSVMKFIGESSENLKKRIEEVREQQHKEPPKRDDIMVDGSGDPVIEQEKAHKRASLEAYLDRVLAMPTTKGGTNMSEKMKPYLEKTIISGKNNITQDDIDKVINIVERDPIDYKQIAMVCPEEAEDCPHRDCPFKKIYKLPTGDRCPVELAFIDNLTQQYMEEMLFDEDEMIGAVEYNMIVSLVDANVTDMRMRGMITQLGYLIDEQSIDPRSGKDIFNKRINPLIEMMKTNDKRKSTILRQLLATPEMRERLKVKKKTRKDNEMKDTSLREKKVERLIDKVKQHKQLKLKGNIS